MPSQVRLALGLVAAGLITLALGVAFVYWPAGVIALGVGMIIGGAYFVEIPEEKPEQTRGRRR